MPTTPTDAGSTTHTQRRSRVRSSRGFNILCWLLASTFVLGGAAKFLPSGFGDWPPYAERFVDWGYPSWVRFFVGGVELIGGVLLCNRGTRTVAAGTLLPIVIGAVVTHIINDDPFGESIAAPIVLLLLIFIGWTSAPWNWHTAWGAPAETPNAASGYRA